MRDDIVSVQVTFPSLDEARHIARLVIEEGLAACVNLGTHEAVYRWQGRIETRAEASFVAKTTRHALQHLSARIASVHPDELPCIVATPVIGGHAPFLDWVAAETDGPV